MVHGLRAYQCVARRTRVESGKEVGLIGHGSGLEVRGLGLEAEMAEDPPDHVSSHDVGDVAEAATAGRAGQGVDLQTALHQRGPAVVRRRSLAVLGSGVAGIVAGQGACQLGRGWLGNELGTPPVVR